MTRVLLFALMTAGLLSASSRADVEVAPPPREVRPDGTRDLAPAPDATAAEDPAVTVDRIIKNSKAVGDRLAGTDTGAATRSTQDRILKDIESLINMQNDSDSKSGGDSSDKDKDQKSNKNDGQKDKSDGKKNDGKDPSGGMKQESNDGNSPKGGMEPKDGNNRATSGHRPRKGSRGGKDRGKEPDMGMANNGPMEKSQESMPGMNEGPKKKDTKAGAVAGNPMGPTEARPSLPINDEVVKEVWGHLPDKLRQQVTQYYREQFMPKYADLLKQYYSSLANSPPRMP